MRRGNNPRRVVRLATYLVTGAILLQFGGCIAMALNSGAAAFDVGSLLDENELLFGVFAPCGRPNVQLVDGDGVPLGGVLFSEDDLIWDCPITEILDPDG